MPEFEALTQAVEDLASDIADNNARNAELQAAIEEQNCRLSKFAPRSLLRSVTATLALCGILVAGVLGVVVYLNHQTTCGVRGVLMLAQSTASRNPIPPGLSPEALEQIVAQRARAQQFYRDALGKLDVLWSCPGESGR